MGLQRMGLEAENFMTKPVISVIGIRLLKAERLPNASVNTICG